MRALNQFTSDVYLSILSAHGFTFAKRSGDPLAFGLIRRPTVYRAISDDGNLEHFVLLGSDIKRGRDFVGAFGIRNEQIDRFSYSCMLEFGSESMKSWWADNPPDFDFYCVLLRTFYRLESDGRSMPTIYLIDDSDVSKLAAHVTDIVKEKISPLVRSIKYLSDFLEVLVSDKDPWRWNLSSPIGRASQTIALSLRLGGSLANIRNSLRPHTQRIAAELQASGKSEEMAIDWFVERIEERWSQYTNIS